MEIHRNTKQQVGKQVCGRCYLYSCIISYDGTKHYYCNYYKVALKTIPTSKSRSPLRDENCLIDRCTERKCGEVTKQETFLPEYNFPFCKIKFVADPTSEDLLQVQFYNNETEYASMRYTQLLGVVASINEIMKIRKQERR